MLLDLLALNSKGELLEIAEAGSFYWPGVLPVTQPTITVHWNVLCFCMH